MRECPRCETERVPEAFYKSRKECRECQADDGRARYLSDPEGWKSRSTAWRAANPRRSWVTSALCNARMRARKIGKPFDLTRADLEALVVDRCPALGFELTYGGGEGMVDSTATLDRIDSRKGYVRGNVGILSSLANRIKTNATAAQVRAVLTFMEASA